MVTKAVLPTITVTGSVSTLAESFGPWYMIVAVGSLMKRVIFPYLINEVRLAQTLFGCTQVRQ